MDEAAWSSPVPPTPRWVESRPTPRAHPLRSRRRMTGLMQDRLVSPPEEAQRGKHRPRLGGIRATVEAFNPGFVAHSAPPFIHRDSGVSVVAGASTSKIASVASPGPRCTFGAQSRPNPAGYPKSCISMVSLNGSDEDGTMFLSSWKRTAPGSSHLVDCSSAVEASVAWMGLGPALAGQAGDDATDRLGLRMELAVECRESADLGHLGDLGLMSSDSRSASFGSFSSWVTGWSVWIIERHCPFAAEFVTRTGRGNGFLERCSGDRLVSDTAISLPGP